MINIVEIKARSSNQEKIRDILLLKKAVIKGTDHQIDTYFNVKHGRLKLREGSLENNLIHYHRENKEGPKLSNVTLYPSQVDSSLKEVLTKSMGILVVVDKQREIYFIDNVKFHIDVVRELGTFIEIEAIDETGLRGKEELLKQCQYYMDLFHIEAHDLVPVSYSDLLLQKVN